MLDYDIFYVGSVLNCKIFRHFHKTLVFKVWPKLIESLASLGFSYGIYS